MSDASVVLGAPRALSVCRAVLANDAKLGASSGARGSVVGADSAAAVPQSAAVATNQIVAVVASSVQRSAARVVGAAASRKHFIVSKSANRCAIAPALEPID